MLTGLRSITRLKAGRILMGRMRMIIDGGSGFRFGLVMRPFVTRGILLFFMRSYGLSGRRRRIQLQMFASLLVGTVKMSGRMSIRLLKGKKSLD